MLKRSTKSILRAAGCSYVMLLVIVAFSGVISAQSQDPANPTPITSNTVEGQAGAEGATYYYSYKAPKGSVTITLKGLTNYYATIFDLELRDASGKSLGKIYFSAEDTAKSEAKTFSFASAQTVTLIVTLLKDKTLKWQKYTITLSAAKAGQKTGSATNVGSSSTDKRIPQTPSNKKPNPEPVAQAPLPDLVIGEVKVTADKVMVTVRNKCAGKASASRLRMQVFESATKEVAVGPVPEIDVPPVAGNASTVVTFPLDPPVKSFIGRYIRLDIDLFDKIKETVETNNWWETGAAPFPDPVNSCNPPK